MNPKAANSFTDTMGRIWYLKLTIGEARRLKEEHNFDVMAVISGNELEKLIADPFMLVDLVWEMIRSSAERESITKDMWLGWLEGDTIDAMVNAFLEALKNFFRSGQRQVFEALIRKMNQVEKIQTERAQKFLDGPEITKVIEDQMDHLEQTALKTVQQRAQSLQRNAGNESTSPPAS